MIRTILFVVGGVLLAGIIHIAVVLFIPDFANRDAWTSMGRFGVDGAFHVLPLSEPGTEPLPYLDPRMAHAVCRFSLDKDPIRIRAAMPDAFWSLAVFDRRGSNIYSLNDRTAERTDIDLVIATPLQLTKLRENPISTLDQSIVIEVPASRGFVLIRAFIEDAADSARVHAALAAAQCAADLSPPPAAPALPTQP
jgi:uncharacterized membrane protein